jgi:hypothetical protein
MREIRTAGGARATKNAATGLPQLARNRPRNRNSIPRRCAKLLGGSVACGRRTARSDDQPIMLRLRPDVRRAMHSCTLSELEVDRPIRDDGDGRATRRLMWWDG